MKSSILFLFMLFMITVRAQDKPYGTVNIGNDTYFDETEVDIGSWLSYYSWTIINEGYEAAQKVLPDSNAIESLVWSYIKRKSTDNFDLQGAYTSQPVGYFDKKCMECKTFGERLTQTKYCGLIHFPVTGVSYEQVVKFCQWRSKMLGKNEYTYRLPTPEEWKKMGLKSLKEDNRKYGSKDSINKNNYATFNYKAICHCWRDTILGHLMGVGSFPSETTGLYEVYGNVSEMTSEKGIAIGGNFTLYANQCHVDSVQNYVKPELWLGFRCIAVKNDNQNKPEVKVFVQENMMSLDSSHRFGKYLDSRDGKIYPVVLIGKQIWMAANLAYKPDSGNFWAWNNEEKFVAQYGYLYNWETARNVCPVGWHLPSKEDFDILLLNLGGNETKKAFEELIPSGNSGFSILYAGLRFGISFVPIGSNTAIWSSSEKDKRFVWALGLGEFDQLAGLRNRFKKKDGLPVRCIKDK